jgi:hypothetical protein
VTDEPADIEYSISPIGNYASGGSVIEFRDVTEQKKMEHERLNAILITEQQSSVYAPKNYRNTLSLHDAVRIKSDQVHKANMTSFVSFVCHELRNPLQGVTSSAVCQVKLPVMLLTHHETGIPFRYTTKARRIDATIVNCQRWYSFSRAYTSRA